MNQAAFDGLYHDTRSSLLALGNSVVRGMNPEQFGRRMADLLEYQNAEAVLIGKQAAGDYGELDDDDQTFAREIVDGQLDYIAGFVGEIKAGAISPAQIQARVQFYAETVLHTANQVMVLASDEPMWNWRLGPADHCSDCVELAEGSPYRELPTIPGACQTMCKFNCACRIESSNGLKGFVKPS